MSGFAHFLKGERIIAASPADVWAVVSDFHHVDRWAPTVKRVVPVGGIVAGIGVARRCTVRGLGTIDEVVNVWDEAERLGYAIEPIGPIGCAQSDWTLEYIEPGATKVCLRLSYDMRFGILGDLANRLIVRRLLGRNLPGALALLKRAVERVEAPVNRQ